jgi:hypothetical protein
MKASEFSSSPYFNAADVGDKPKNWIIAAIAKESIGRDDPTEKPVLDLIDGDGKPAGRRLVLNKTNLAARARVFGDDMESWIGQTIRMQSVWTAYCGERVRGIGVTPAPAALRSAGSAGGAAAAVTAGAARRTDPAGRKDDLNVLSES